MEFLPLTQNGKVNCRHCLKNDRFSPLAQMPFVAICDRGHLQDFPWREWAHRQHRPSCAGNLSYVRSGGGTLAAQKIRCECGAERSLLYIDKATFSATHLSFHLSKKDGLYFCRGHRPWLGETADVGCDSYLRGNPRNAGNVWFPQTVSAIYLPEEEEDDAQRMPKLRDFLAKADVVGKIRSLEARGEKNTASLLKIFYPEKLDSYDAAQIDDALKNDSGANHPDPAASAGEIGEIEFRHAEFKVLRQEQRSEFLQSKTITIESGNSILSNNFSRLVKISRLRETRAFAGFSRIFSDNAPTLDDRKALLRRKINKNGEEEGLTTASGEGNGQVQMTDWLPATTVFGEGIYLELKEERLRAWEKFFGGSLRRHLAPIEAATSKIRRKIGNGGDNDNNAVVAARNETDEKIGPRFVLIHTLAHVLINQLSVESGYGTAGLRERIYVSENKSTPMAGLLIYTADGDSAGTLGGLVNLGTPEHLEKLLKRALRNARWCASDPGCSEVGTSRGLGPENRNLAACHACALLPETSCEGFNRYLDRSLLVGHLTIR